MIKRLMSALAALTLVTTGTVALSASPALAATTYEYNGFAQDFTSDPATGACVTMTIGKPYVDNSVLSGAHSLGELSIESAGGGDNVEFGWTVDKSQRADGNPILFGSHHINHVWKGYTTGWVDNASNPINLGSGLPKPVDKTFCLGQTSTHFTATYDGVLVATLPKSRWTPGGVAQPFNAAVADVIQVKAFNESASHEANTCNDLGTGQEWNATIIPPGAPPVTTWSSFSVTGTTITPNWTTAWGSPGTAGVWGANATSGTGGTTGGPGWNGAGTGSGGAGIC